MEHLKNLNIVITAGASGIGSEMAIEFQAILVSKIGKRLLTQILHGSSKWGLL